MELIYNNKATFHIASDSFFHEKTEHITVDCHLLGRISLRNVQLLASSTQITN